MINVYSLLCVLFVFLSFPSIVKESVWLMSSSSHFT